MTPQRRAAIIGDIITRRGRLQVIDQLFREAVDADWKKSADEEFAGFLEQHHGKRLPKAERDRIRREIEGERRAVWREETERAYTQRELAYRVELPVLEGYGVECQMPETAEEAFRRRHPQDGRDMNGMIATGLLEVTARPHIRATVHGRKPQENLARWRGLQGLNGDGPPQQAILDAIESQEIEAADGRYTFDPKDDAQATAATALTRAIGETRQSRLPKELIETMEELRKASSFVALRKEVHKLRLLSVDELDRGQLGEGA